jgi:hypothetical protein
VDANHAAVALPCTDRASGGQSSSMDSGISHDGDRQAPKQLILEEPARALLEEHARTLGPDELSVRRVWRRLILSLREEAGCDGCEGSIATRSCVGSDIVDVIPSVSTIVSRGRSDWIDVELRLSDFVDRASFTTWFGTG